MSSDAPGSKAAQTGARLRQAAVRVFAEKGYADTKVSDIVREAGVSQPTFYLHFDSKERAYDALQDEFREGLREATLSNLIEGRPASIEVLVDQLTTSFERFLRYMAQDRKLTEIGFFQPPGCSVTKAQFVDWVRDNMAQEQLVSVFRDDVEAIDIARTMVGMLDQFGRLDIPATEIRALAATCATIFCRGARAD